MQITHNNKPYTLDADLAIRLGVLTPNPPPTKNISLTEDEAAVIVSILEKVGGDPQGARGQSNSVLNKIHNVFGNPETHFDLSSSGSLKPNCIYFR